MESLPATNAGVPMRARACDRSRASWLPASWLIGVSLCGLLALFQLLLPSQNARLVGLRLGLWDHALALIQDGKAGMRDAIVGVQLGNAISDLDGLVELLRVLVSPRQAVHGVKKGRIGGDGRFVLPDGFLVMPLSVQIERRVVMVFRGLSGLVGGHPAFRGSGLSLAGCPKLGEAGMGSEKGSASESGASPPIY